MEYPPIVVMSFNRPEKLKEVLESLRGQRGVDIGKRQIYLFQDGAVNKYSRIRYTTDDLVQQCVAVFKQIFPAGVVQASPQNIGVCENFDRAETFVFDTLNADCAYFFEDDLILSPVYVQMLDLMRAQARNLDNVAYFAAYGDYYSEPLEAADPQAVRLGALDHHWGFGLFARHRAAIRERIAPYLDIVMRNDYSRRDHRAVYDLYEELGSSPRGTSQDAAKARASAALGYWRCNTITPFARYEGDVGAHMNKELFDQIGFSRVRVREQPLTLTWPQKPEIAGFVSEQRALFRKIAETELAELRLGLPQFLNPVRLCTAKDLDDVYRLLLGRPVEALEIYERHVGRSPVFEFVRSVARSSEFEKLTEGGYDPDREAILNKPVSRDDIAKIYRLSVHREPESDDVDLAHKSGVGALYFFRSKLRSEECQTLWSRIEL